MIDFSASEFKHIATEGSFLKGFIKEVAIPRIRTEANFGRYSTEIILSHFPHFTEQTKKDLLQLLEAKGFKNKIKDGILTITWG